MRILIQARLEIGSHQVEVGKEDDFARSALLEDLWSGLNLRS